MPVVRDGNGPYAPKPAVMAVVTAYRERSPRFPLTNDNISLIEGVTESLAPRTLQALKLLDLIDENGEPTAAFKGLKEAGRNEFPARLAEVVQQAYSEIFSYRDPTTADPADIQDAFRVYRPYSMRDRMVRLFYGLCEEAELISEAPKITSDAPKVPRAPKPKPAAAAATSNLNPRPEHDAESASARRADADRAREREREEEAARDAGRGRELPGLIAALVDELPAKGATWTREDAQWWLDVARLTFPRAYGFTSSSETEGT